MQLIRFFLKIFAKHYFTVKDKYFKNPIDI